MFYFTFKRQLQDRNVGIERARLTAQNFSSSSLHNLQRPYASGITDQCHKQLQRPACLLHPGLLKAVPGYYRASGRLLVPNNVIEAEVTLTSVSVCGDIYL